MSNYEEIMKGKNTGKQELITDKTLSELRRLIKLNKPIIDEFEGVT